MATGFVDLLIPLVDDSMADGGCRFVAREVGNKQNVPMVSRSMVSKLSEHCSTSNRIASGRSREEVSVVNIGAVKKTKRFKHL